MEKCGDVDKFGKLVPLLIQLKAISLRPW